MTDGAPQRSNEEANRLLLERMARAAEAESPRARARRWRGSSEGDRWRAFVGVVRLAYFVNRSREKPYVKEPLDFPRFSSSPRDS